MRKGLWDLTPRGSFSFLAKDEASLRKSSVGAMGGCEGRDAPDLGLTFGEVSDRLAGCDGDGVGWEQHCILPVLYYTAGSCV